MKYKVFFSKIGTDGWPLGCLENFFAENDDAATQQAKEIIDVKNRHTDPDVKEFFLTKVCRVEREATLDHHGIVYQIFP